MPRIAQSKVSHKFLTTIPKPVQLYLNLKEGDYIEYYTPLHDFQTLEGVMAIKVRRQYATVEYPLKERGVNV